MQVGLVLGSAVSTVRHPSWAGRKMIVVQLLMADGRTPEGEPLVALDTVGAGRGDRVIVSSDGRSTRELVADPTSPIRYSVLGICDS